MNAIQRIACASPGGEITWNRINWANCERTVSELQARIVKATKVGRWGKVKALQWLLTHSLSGKALAVKRVTENQGKRTPGIDGEIWKTPAAKTRALSFLGRRGYKPQPLRRVYIPKSNGKLRPLGMSVQNTGKTGMCARSSWSSCARRTCLPSAVVSQTKMLSLAAPSVSALARPLPTRTIRVGLPLYIATTGLVAKINLARGREKRTKVRPVTMAVKANPQTISIATITWP